ncbi:hypothetical protein QR680_016463 [Steinernema hermaphroditum]|uniref:7TM GPCR serpentine receptor class x (Srx) domain-containing protein n=1 Tax=Steinernema hermaphroditum TaxID=289476 RepID=A0AA39LMD2_9BILA|nr:hypothetical protein QR680_016463 [Steinernema hermaphroditum]
MEAVNLVGGVLYLLISAILFVVNVAVLITTLQFKENGYISITYRIMKNLCIACILQLVVFFLGGLMTFYGNSFSATLERIAGSIIQSAWVLYIALELTLAIDRMMTFFQSHLGSKLSYLLLGLSWMHAIAHAIVLLLPGYGVIYCFEEVCLTWNYDGRLPGSIFIYQVERWFLWGAEIGILVCYVIVVIRLVWMRRVSSPNHKMSNTETKILFVSIISFVYESFLILLLYFGYLIIPSTMGIGVMINVLWMLDAGLFSCATIIINTSMRSKMFSMFHKKTIVTRVTSFYT